MKGLPQLEPLLVLPGDMERLRVEAEAAGFRFLTRLVLEWEAGRNKFDAPGEMLLGAFRESRLVGIGGLNRDPYTECADMGRLRHLYVEQTARGSGIGSALVKQLLERARGTFRSVRLRTDTEEAANFYARLGFHSVSEGAATHMWSW